MNARLSIALLSLLGLISLLVLQEQPVRPRTAGADIDPPIATPEAEVPEAEAPKAEAPDDDSPERRPSEYGWLQRTYPYFDADPRAYADALVAARTMARLGKGKAIFGAWRAVGPTNVGGRVVDLAYDPSSPATVYAAAATGGVFKSADGGSQWSPIFDQQAMLNIGDIALAPSAPSTIYVGTGEPNGGHNNFAGAGVYKSTDSGASWRSVGLVETTSISRILVHPTQPETVYVAAMGSYFLPTPDRGLYRSTDGGQTWKRTLFVNDSTGVIDLVMRPDDPSVLFAATWERVRRPTQARLYGAGSGIYKSTDGGTTWTPLSPESGLPRPERYEDADGIPRLGRIGLTISKADPDLMYALYNNGTRYLGFYRSSDGGDTWVNADPNQFAAAGTAGFSWYFGQVRAHPTDTTRVYALDVAMMHSTDQGFSWAYTYGGDHLHVDYHALAFNPDDPQDMIVGHDGGISRSRDGGQTWEKAQDLPITQFYEVNYDPAAPNQYYGGTQDNGTIRVQSAHPFDWHRILGGDGFYTLIHPDDPNIIYAESQFGALQKSTDGGRTFLSVTNGIPANEPRNWSTPIAMDPANPDVIYYGTNRLYVSRNAGGTWEAISENLTRHTSGSLGTLTSIAISPIASEVLFVGTDDGKVWFTDDGGATWKDRSLGLPNRWVTRIVFDSHDVRRAYVSFSGLKWKDPQPHVFLTRDGGATWTDRSGNLPDAPVNALAIDPLYPQVVFVGTDVGAYYTLDGGFQWEALGLGLPAVSVYDLKVDPERRILVAGTHGRSMYVLDLSNIGAAFTETTPGRNTFRLSANYPNPFSHTTALNVWTDEAGTLTLTIHDVLGRRLKTLAHGFLQPGTRTFTWNTLDESGTPVASGTYLARLSFSGKQGEGHSSTLLTLVR